MANRIFEYLQEWKKMVDYITQGYSILLSLPRYSGSNDVINTLTSRLIDNEPTIIIELKSGVQSFSGRLDYHKLWETTKAQLNINSRTKVTDRATYDGAFKSFLRKMTPKDQIIVILLGVGKKAEEGLYDLISLFHHMARICRKDTLPNLRFIAADNYSISYYERALQNTIGTESELNLMKRIRFSIVPLISIEEFVGSIRSTCSLDQERKKEISSKLFSLSGGHLGLLQDILADIEHKNWEISDEYWSVEVDGIISGCQAMDGIRRDIHEDAIGISKTALEFEIPKYPVEFGSPRIELLIRLGIIYWKNVSQTCLIGGSIRKLLEEISQNERSGRVGTVISSTGVRRFVEHELMPVDEDIVMIHLSDLHIGKDHGFRMSQRGIVKNEGKYSLSGVLSSDLSSLGLLKRVDGLIISGDIVCHGKHSEFQRAKDIISDILETLSLDSDKLSLVAGNHDLEWNPDEFSATIREGISREAFETFCQQLKIASDEGPHLTRFVSRNGKRKLCVIGVDSNFVEGENSAGIGYVSNDSMSKAVKLLEEDASGGFDDRIVWLVVHHHIFPVTSALLDEARGKKVSIMGNAPELLNTARNLNVELVLHGHQHQPCVTFAQRWIGESNELSFSPIAIIGAGSCGAVRERLGPISRNQYYVLVRRKDELIIRSRIMGEEGLNFTAHNDLSLTFPN